MSPRRLRVLVIEDELGMRELLVYELSAKGFAVETARDGVEGLERLRGAPFDAVITDLKMPRMGGLDALRQIKELRPDTHVVMVTAHATIESAVAAMKHGAIDFVRKPFEVDAVARLIETAVRRRRLEAVAAVHEASRRLSEAMEPEEVLPMICGLVSRQLEGALAAVVSEEAGGLAAHSGDAGPALRDWALAAAREAGAGGTRCWASVDVGGVRRAAAAAALKGGSPGALVAARSADRPFSAADIRLLEVFAAEVSLALRARAATRRLDLAEADLARAESCREVAALAAGVCHELGNGLACIEGYAQLLLEEEGLPQLAREGLETIIAQSARCAAMTDDLVDLGRPSADSDEVFPLSQPLQAALRLCRYDFKKEGVELAADLGGGALVRGDRGRLQQVFLNLIRNAIEAMSGRAERRLAVSLEAAGGRARARLIDTGCGLRPEDRERLFEPFFSTKGRAGTGLGLYLSRQIAARHGGALTIDGEPGRGASACLELPLAL